MSDEVKAVLAVSAFVGLLALLVSTVIIVMAPTILVVFGAWDAFAYWYPIAVTIGRVTGLIVFCLHIAFAVLGKPVYLFSAVVSIIMVIWGYPVLLDAVMRLGFSELSGLDFQRAVLTIIFIEGMNVSASLVNKKGARDKDE